MEKVKRFPSLSWQTFLKLGRDDPRRVIHALKVGFALTVVSLLYLLELLSKGIGQNAVWAVMTVALVLEFTAGATLCKGLNRGLGTVAAGSLILLMEMIATECGKGFRAILIGGSVFVIGAAATYVRFVPCIKKNFDYGVVIFLLTFNLFAVSTYRSDNVLKIVHERFYTIVIGCCICLAMSLLVFPNWSGEDLHNSTVYKLEGLSKSVEACVSEYFNDEEPEIHDEGESDEDPVYKGYIAVLDSKSNDETLALHASWEPRHSTYKFPGKQYIKLGAVLRHFGYTVVALHGCMQTEIKTPRSIRALFKDPCTRLAGEVSKALLELANSIRHRRQCSPEILSDHLNDALKDLNIALLSQPKLFLGPPRNEITYMQGLQAQAATATAARQSSGKTESSPLFDWRSSRKDSEKSDPAAEKKVLRPTLSKLAITSLEFSEALPFAAFASLLVESVARLDRVIYEVEELGRIASFKKFKPGDEVVLNMKRHNVENAAMFAE